ncbi:hypothetical protein NP233_g12277 [Leucocoprinus birnbaumii]|uniref:HAT C-terminal dimerisation domain-containing protein n=1 Tax=Leucocoprinus birnbaumii TaxID=56174 RepID=A0AAD5VF20_9AGAR|nr:hypothetical protein NP233_g12277 [Leucocoprinus birnbaumii]
MKRLVGMVRSSSLRRQYFSDICRTLYKKDIQLIHDVDTRWSSTLYMIERAVSLRAVVTQFLEIPEFSDLRCYAITDAEWKSLEIFTQVLSVPDAFQHRLSGEKTLNLSEAIPAFEAMIYKWKHQQMTHPEISSIIQASINKLTVYHQRARDIPAYIVLMVLNLSMKLAHFYKHCPEDVLDARRTLMNELETYYSSSNHSTPQQPSQASPTDTSGLQSFADDVTTNEDGLQVSWADQILGLGPVTPITSSARYSSLEAEVDAYLTKPSIAGVGVIEYWQLNQSHYPTLFTAALDFLAIQSSAVPCERVFSSAKETMTDRRNKISHGLMEELQMLKFRFRGSSSLNFTRSLNKAEELTLLETLNSNETHIPHELPQFSQFLAQMKQHRAGTAAASDTESTDDPTSSTAAPLLSSSPGETHIVLCVPTPRFVRQTSRSRALCEAHPPVHFQHHLPSLLPLASCNEYPPHRLQTPVAIRSLTHSAVGPRTHLTIPLRTCCPDCFRITDQCLKEGSSWQEKFTRGARRRRSASLDSTPSGGVGGAISVGQKGAFVPGSFDDRMLPPTLSITVDEVDKRRRSHDHSSAGVNVDDDGEGTRSGLSLGRSTALTIHDRDYSADFTHFRLLHPPITHSRILDYFPQRKGVPL